jgi:Ca2+-binding EF-hand superfamily protein
LFASSFERELKNKLAEKTKGAQSEETVLKKAFKYFDLNDNGTVEPDEFAKAIEKIGIQIPTKQVSIMSQSHPHHDRQGAWVTCRIFPYV